MKASELRKSILQAAVQGKLVPQDLHDEPASELLECIRAEKIKLIKEEKLKKEKPLPPITEDEIPYDLPEGWVWCRFGELCKKLTDGSHNPPPNTGSGYPVISAKNIKNGIITFENINRYTDQKGFDKENPRTQITKGDLILGIIGGSIGNLAIYTHDDKVIAQRSIAIIRTIAVDKFAAVFLRSPLLQDFLGMNSSGTAQGGFYLGQLKNLIFPLPPVTEQARILKKIDELMTLCDELETAENQLEALEKHFIEYLPKSILKMAVQGKMVPQDLHDEPASELLDRIRAEKIKLIKENKIKNGKPIPPILDDEIPYELPEGWVWCQLSDIADFKIGKTPARACNDYWENGLYPWVSIADMQSGQHLQTTKEKVSQLAFDEVFKSVMAPKGSLLFSFKLSIGKVSILDIDALTNEAICSITPYKYFKLVDYLFCVFPALDILADANDAIKGKTLNSKSIAKILIPLPPLAEQQRIVVKVNELMRLCNELKTAKTKPIKTVKSNIVSLPQVSQSVEETGIAARGDATQPYSSKLQGTIGKLFEEEQDE